MRLNREQLRASAVLTRPVRIVAGAGTGKTAVITERFRRLVAAGVDPASILVMTFTERAAAEMRGRIESELARELGSWIGDLWVGTFHSIAQSLLREEGWRTGLPFSFGILAGADRWILLRQLLWEIGDPVLVGVERPDDLVAPLLRLLERFKQELIPFSRVAEWARGTSDRELGDQLLASVRMFRAYESRCREQRLLDFDDLLLRLIELLEKRPEIRERYVKRFTSLLVDEYQDSNLAQERIVELLGSHGRVTVVGDDDQSIYRFRGASLASMARFVEAFPAAETWTLGRNQRSTANITVAASAVITHNQERIQKVLTSAANAGPKVMVWHCDDGLDEALAIADEISRLRRSGQSLGRIALLVRTNAMTRLPVLALRSGAIPFQLWGARGFYRRPEILDAIAFFRVLNDPADEVALARLLGSPGAGVDVPAALEVLKEARGKGVPPLPALLAWPPGEQLATRLRSLQVAATRLGVDELFFELMSRTSYLEVATYSSESERRQAAANLGKFAELLEGYCSRRVDHSLREFMAHLDLVLLSEVDEEVAQAEDVEDAVQVMTIHQAKGLEFDVVFVPSVVEGRLPQVRRNDRFDVPADLAPGLTEGGREDHVAEERRLLYVAMTRARTHLYLTWATRYEGGREWKPSRFLDEMKASAAGRYDDLEIAPLAGFSRAVLGDLLPGSEPGAAAREFLTAAPPVGGGDPLRLSFSAIDTYRECPRQYRFRYVYRLPAPPSAEGQYGDIVHFVLQRLGALRKEGRALDSELVETVQSGAWTARPFADLRRRPAYERLGRVQVDRYLAAGGLSEAPVAVEQSFTADLDGWSLRGIMDRVDPPPSQKGGGWESLRGGGPEPIAEAPAQPRVGARIVDYKTGNPLPAGRLRRDLQLALYALGARVALGLEAVELEIVYLKEGRSVVLEASPELLADAERMGRGVAAAIGAGRFEARPERRRCALCAYRLACDEAL